jgi:AmmeMemoRadiSam system protein B
VRRNLGGKLYLVTYGKAAAVHLDPVEKKPLYHFHPGEGILSLGTVGCNLFCAFCQNWQISQFREFSVSPEGHLDRPIGEDWPPERIVATAEALGVRLIAYTYNEPAVFMEYAHDTARLAKARGMKNVFVTSGFETKEAWDYIRPYLDAANVDLKGFTEKFYREVCGARLKPVLESLEHLVASGVWVEVTTLLLEGYNDLRGGGPGHGPLPQRPLPQSPLAPHRRPPRLPNARPEAHPARHLGPGLRDRQGRGAQVRLRGQRPGRSKELHPLPGLRPAPRPPAVVQGGNPLAGARGLPGVREEDSRRMDLVRPAYVAGQFYPGEREALREEVASLLKAAKTPPLPGVRGVLAPHAGYGYSGKVAAESFKAFSGFRGQAQRAILLGPSHFVPFLGVAFYPYRAWRTPLGEVAVDLEGGRRLLERGFPFLRLEEPFWEEHSLEVLLPFLQVALPGVPILPLLFGEVDPLRVAEALLPELSPQDLVVASSDLSHYHPDPVARERDRRTLEIALSLDAEALSRAEACGRLPWASLTALARAQGWRPRLLAYATSAEAFGDRRRVVGYAAVAYGLD